MLNPKKAAGKYLALINNAFTLVDRRCFGILSIIRSAIVRFSKLHGAEGAASVSFFAIFSLPPMLIVIVSITSFYLKGSEIRQIITRTIQETVPMRNEIIVEMFDQLLVQRNALGILGILGFAWSGSGALSSLIANINRAWPTAQSRNIIEKRLISMMMIGTLILLLVSTSVFNTIYSVIVQLNLIHLGIDPTLDIFSDLAFFTLRCLLFFALYYWIPKARVGKLAATVAALFASIAWEITARAFGWYLQAGLELYNFLYGSLGTLAAFMFWVYLDSLIIIFGAYLGAAIGDSSRNSQT